MLPWKLFRAMEKEDTKKENGGSKQQLMLDHIMVKEKKSEFSCADLLHEVAKFVTCDDQVCPITFQTYALNLIDGVARCL